VQSRTGIEWRRVSS